MTIRKRLLIIIIPAIIIVIASIYFVVRISVIQTVTNLEKTNARNLLRIAMLSIENQYRGLIYHKQYSYDMRKAESENVIDIALSVMYEHYNEYLAGNKSLLKAQTDALNDLNRFRYDSGNGYIWLIKNTKPVSYILQHPIMPEINNRLANDPYFVSGPDSVSILQMAVNKCETEGKGFIEYDWYKPEKDSLEIRQSKISFVKLFEPWQWVVVTGVYVDDIDKAIDRRLNAIIDELRITLGEISIAQTGYFYIMTSENRLIVHPYLDNVFIDTSAIQPPFEEIVHAASTNGMYRYEWNMPPDFTDLYKFWKVVYVEYFEPLDWYVCASFYEEEINYYGNILGRRVLVIVLFFAMVSIVGFYYMANSFSKPIYRLSRYVSNLNLKTGSFANTTLPETSFEETQTLSKAISDMLSELEKHRTGLEHLIMERTYELEASNEELKASNDELHKKSKIIEEQRDELEAAITDLKKAQSKLVEAEKMASLGTLTAGVAHEINNPLNYIMGGVDGLEKYFLKFGSQNEKTTTFLLNSIKSGIERTSNIVSSLNQFSRTNTELDEDCNIHEILDNCLTILHNQIKNKVEVEKDYVSELLIIRGNVGKLHQVFTNIFTNSVQAIEHKGRINIETKILNNKAVIKIKDTGCGIPKKYIHQITNPFFTTKGPGKGTGLGLSISYSIIQDHKGSIHFISEEGLGTEAKISFPLKNKIL